MADLTEKLLNWLPMTASMVHDHGPAAFSLRQRYLCRHPGAQYWINDSPWPTNGLLQGLLDVLVLRLAASRDLRLLAGHLLSQRLWLSHSGVILLALPDQGLVFSTQLRSNLAKAGLYLTKQGFAENWRVLVFMVATPKPFQIRAIPLSEQAGIVDVRIRQPLRALSTLPDVHTELLQLPLMGTTVAQASKLPTVVLWQRPILDPDLYGRLIQRIQLAGHKLVVDFDDHPARWPAIEQAGYFTFRAPDGVVTSTPLLRDLLSAFCSKVMLRPNTCHELPQIINPLVQDPLPSMPMQILFASLNRSQDAHPYLRGINSLLARHPNSFCFHIVGDKSFYDALSSAQKTFEPHLCYRDYIKRLSKADLVFCPLADTLFNRHKSALKFVEAGSFAKPLIASEVVYSAVIKHGVNGLIAHPDNVHLVLEKIAENPGMVRSMGYSAYDDVQERWMTHYSLQQYSGWFRDLF